MAFSFTVIYCITMFLKLELIAQTLDTFKGYRVHFNSSANLKLCILFCQELDELAGGLQHQIVNCRFILLHFFLPLHQLLHLEID